MKLWGGRFSKATAEQVEAFNASITFDYVLAPYDIQGSMAHLQGLLQAELITAEECEQLTEGLQTILQQWQQGELTWSISDEDIHMNIERKLTELVGPVAGKLHTGRSRNDQVALDLHLYCRDNVNHISELLQGVIAVFAQLAEQHAQAILPGYTHLQRAQPVRLQQHLLAYVSMFKRDLQRLQHSQSFINVCPLGAGALAGSGYAIDRRYVAELLGFDDVYSNSMDAVSDRDFVLSVLSDLAIIAQHLSRLSEELILWNSQEFSFIQFDDAYCTGSSMMPQKKNPDIPELIRGKTGRVYGNLIAMLTTLKGLPLCYNKDLQEDKQVLFDSVQQVSDCLSVLAPMLATMTINTDNMRQACAKGFVNATALADYCVEKGMPFRQAHELIGVIVKHCIDNNTVLEALSLDTLQDFNSIFEADCFEKIHLDNITTRMLQCYLN